MLFRSDRKSTRLNSSHMSISYAVFCLKKKKRILAYHEGGHALMSHLMGGALPVHQVTIVSRGQALGYTLNLPTEDRYLHTKEELIDMMRVFLAGRAASRSSSGGSRT